MVNGVVKLSYKAIEPLDPKWAAYKMALKYNYINIIFPVTGKLPVSLQSLRKDHIKILLTTG